LAWAPAVDDKPLDRQDDTNFRLAVANLQQAEPDGDLSTIPEVAPPRPMESMWLLWLVGLFLLLWLLITASVVVLLLR